MTIKKLFFYSLIFAFLLGLYIPAQETKKNLEQQKKQKIPKPSYEVEVTVTNINVVVTGKSGNRITDLKPENFEIYEDGLLQRLTNFYEVKGMEIHAPVPEKEREKEKDTSLLPLKPQPQKSLQFKNKIIIYFDNWHLHPLNRNWSIKKLESFIRNNFAIENNNNAGMVVSLSQKIEVLQEFTSNQWQLLGAVNEAKKRTGQSLLRAKIKEDMRRELSRMVSETNMADNKYESFQSAMSFARNYVESEQGDLLFSLKSLNAFIDYLSGIEGKKILIYVSDGLPLNPGEEIFDYIDSAFPVGNARAEAMNYDATSLFKELTAKCNASEIALYPINAKGLEVSIPSADQRAGWNVYSRGSGMVKATSRVKNRALKLMAQDTGGLAILNTNDIETGLERIEDDLQFYYSLGYVSPHREDNEYHSIKVKLVGVQEKYDVRVRHGYVRISQKEKIKEAVFSRLFLERAYNPMNLRVQVLPFESMSKSKRLRLTLKILIPIKNITLYSQEDYHTGQIEVYIALMDSRGHISPCHELSQEIKILAVDYYDKALRSSYPYLAEMYVDPDQYIISLAVKDVLGDIINYLQLRKTIE